MPVQLPFRFRSRLAHESGSRSPLPARRHWEAVVVPPRPPCPRPALALSCAATRPESIKERGPKPPDLLFSETLIISVHSGVALQDFPKLGIRLFLYLFLDSPYDAIV